jgi:hypothetical protein
LRPHGAHLAWRTRRLFNLLSASIILGSSSTTAHATITFPLSPHIHYRDYHAKHIDLEYRCADYQEFRKVLDDYNPFATRSSNLASNAVELEQHSNPQAGMMNGRHLPAGQQNMPQDMGRRRQYNQGQQQYQPTGPVYNGYMNPYHANNNYYPPQYQQQYPLQYQHAGNPYSQNPYPPPPPHVRSPPPTQHYGHPQMQQPSYPRPQPSPAISAPYQQPPPLQTPPSTHSSHTIPGPMTPPTPQIALSVAAASPPPQAPRLLFTPPVSVTLAIGL